MLLGPSCLVVNVLDKNNNNEKALFRLNSGKL